MDDIWNKKSDVYFIQRVSGGPIKIGVSGDLIRRLKEIQTCHDEKLQIIKIIQNGGKVLEHNLHLKFKDCRIRGEWFQDTDKLKDYIQTESKDVNPCIKDTMEDKFRYIGNIQKNTEPYITKDLNEMNEEELLDAFNYNFKSITVE